MLITVMCGITLLAYMIAINAHGPVRLGLSYMMATILLATTVWVIVQHVTIGMDSVNTEKIKKIEMEKQIAEERAMSQEEALKTNKDRTNFAAKLTTLLTSGTGYASSIANIDLQDRNAELETLLGRAGEVKRKVDELKNEIEKISTTDAFFAEPLTLTRDGLQLLTEAAQYYQQYYYSDDSDQEAARERIMRQKARNASEKFQKASVLLASSG